MKKSLLALAALLALGLVSSPADAEWKDLNGQKVPEVTAKQWWNTGSKTAPSTASLRGKVYVVEFMATW